MERWRREVIHLRKKIGGERHHSSDELKGGDDDYRYKKAIPN